MSDVVPIYQLLTLQLGVAPAAAIGMRGKWNYLRFIDCTDAAGNFSPDGKIGVTVGHRSEDAIPMRINGLIRGETEEYQFSWATQPGLIATLMASWVDPTGTGGLQIEAVPAKQLVTQATGITLSSAQLTVGVAAAVIVPKSVTRQSATIRNRGSVGVFVGGPGVTTSTGMSIDPSETFTFSGTTADIWAVASQAGVPVHTLSEG